jgi:SAM-dependent methyltransferase
MSWERLCLSNKGPVADPKGARHELAEGPALSLSKGHRCVNATGKPDFKPSWPIVAVDFMKRTLKGELHLPPWWLRDVGGGDFDTIGREFLGHFKELAGLQTNEQVLDIGCGSGRMALPLTGYLSSQASYIGLDITKPSIVWCQQHITPRFPNFWFLHADLYNKRYNPGGHCLARDYVFPLADEVFDFIFLTSVFTHMLPEDIENYLREITRLLRSTGRALFTCFLLNDTQRALADQGRNRIDFKYGHGCYRTRSESIPESAVAYEETTMRELLSRCGLKLCEPIHYGAWSGRQDGRSFQDIVLVRCC